MKKNKPRAALFSCDKCGTSYGPSGFLPTSSPFFPNGVTNICEVCLENMIDPDDLKTIDALCQWADYPFLPEKWVPLAMLNGRQALGRYVKTYCIDGEYSEVSWKTTNRKLKQAIEENKEHEIIPEINESRMKDLKKKWGDNYTWEELINLEEFFDNLGKNYPIITQIQRSTGMDLAKLSLRISKKISSNLDVDKDISSYDRLMKVGGFTKDNIADLNNFESLGELYAYLEKTGWINPGYKGEVKDIVDQTQKNISALITRYMEGDPNFREKAKNKLSALGISDVGEDGFSEAELLQYENEGFEALEEIVVETEDEELDVGGE